MDVFGEHILSVYSCVCTYFTYVICMYTYIYTVLHSQENTEFVMCGLRHISIISILEKSLPAVESCCSTAGC